jgi:hypothetical protein
MTASLAVALLLQFAAVMLVRHRLGASWLRRPVTLLLLAAVVYQGVSAVLLAIPSVEAWDNFRLGIRPAFTDSATLLISAGMLALAAGYVLTQPQRVLPAASDADIRAAVSVLDWRVLTAACVPLAVLTYEGRGYNGSISMTAGTPLSTDLAETFFTILVVIAAFSFVQRQGSGWFLPVLIGQSMLLAAAGERTPVIIDAVVLILILAHAGLRPPAWQLRTAIALTMVVVLAVTGARAERGRSLYYGDSGLGSRVGALGGGVASIASPAAPKQSSSPGLIAQAAVRLDGDAFTGAIQQAESLGAPRLNPVYVPESLLLLVPSALWPSKLDHGNYLNPIALEIDNFALQHANFLVGLPGMYAGFMSPLWLVICMTLFGMACGFGERLLFRRWTVARIILLAGAATAALKYEQGLPGMLLAFRTAVVIALIVKAAEIIRRRRNARSLRRRRAGFIPAAARVNIPVAREVGNRLSSPTDSASPLLGIDPELRPRA